MSSCIFCRIVDRTLPSKIIYEDDLVLAFEDVAPQAPVHTLIIPKKHIATLLDVGESELPLISRIVNVAVEIARRKGIAERGFRIVANSNPESGQSVYHVHFHVLGGRQMHWPPG